MSIGPENVEKFKVKTIDRIRHGIKVSLETYFKSPLYYLFYTLLTATAIGLFIGMEYNWKFYILLIFLGAANLFQYIYGKWTDNKDVRTMEKTG